MRTRPVAATLAALAAACLAACTAAPEPLPTPPDEARETAVAPVPPPPPCERIVRIEVSKRAHTLRAHCERGAIVPMRVALGRDSAGPKTRWGDQRTPEGEYRITAPARSSRFHLFIPIDYPSKNDAERAIAEGRLSHAVFERIREAHDRGVLPPQDTALGGFLGIHGEGERFRGDSRLFDWTYGCIAVTDAQIEYLAARVAPGVRVTIYP